MLSLPSLRPGLSLSPRQETGVRANSKVLKHSAKFNAAGNRHSDITPASELLLNDILAGVCSNLSCLRCPRTCHTLGAARITHETFAGVGYTQRASPGEAQATAYPNDVNLDSRTDINSLSPAASTNGSPSSNLDWHNITIIPAGMRAPPSSPSSFSSTSTPATSLFSERVEPN